MTDKPIDMILFCPNCGTQHIDKPGVNPGEAYWHNPPHKSHRCADCGHIWRVADVPTNGVAEIATTGMNDHRPRIRDVTRSKFKV